MTKELSDKCRKHCCSNYHVFGIGDSLKPIIEKIETLRYDCNSKSITGDEILPLPTDDDQMVVVLIDKCDEAVISAVKSYYQAGVLTLVVSNRLIESESEFCDAQAVVDTEMMYETVKTILDILFNNGIISLGFNDILATLQNCGFFKVIVAAGRGSELRVADAISEIEKIITMGDIDAIKSIIISIFCNSEMQPLLCVDEIKPISEFISRLPEEIKVNWGLINDNKMPTDEIRISAIIGHKATCMQD